jgi:hypothetical protein
MRGSGEIRASRPQCNLKFEISDLEPKTQHLKPNPSAATGARRSSGCVFPPIACPRFRAVCVAARRLARGSAIFRRHPLRDAREPRAHLGMRPWRVRHCARRRAVSASWQSGRRSQRGRAGFFSPADTQNSNSLNIPIHRICSINTTLGSILAVLARMGQLLDPFELYRRARRGRILAIANRKFSI